MIAISTYTNTNYGTSTTTDTDATDNCTGGTAIFSNYNIHWTSTAEAFFQGLDNVAILRYENMKRAQKILGDFTPWPLPDPPMLKPCRHINRMMRPNQIGRKTIVVY